MTLNKAELANQHADQQHKILHASTPLYLHGEACYRKNDLVSLSNKARSETEWNQDGAKVFSPPPSHFCRPPQLLLTSSTRTHLRTCKTSDQNLNLTESYFNYTMYLIAMPCKRTKISEHRAALQWVQSATHLACFPYSGYSVNTGNYTPVGSRWKCGI
ncbi:hypothetical protein chiPu_0005110 [Chiloscyllium punctatum]|uniref:Uncharacterized protein n=1 Tax=Chiloscyllium punctatum TaxID=137246 RepID=A0A401S8H4_CHIPU|nr:hypothetical protein [Chiloscyllium punctatum]